MKFSARSVALKAMLAIGLTGTVSAFWRMECRARSGVARIDPLVANGGVSEHVHAIHGGSGFSPTSTTDDLLKSDCTSCSVAEDKSAYWHPAMYFQDSTTGEYELVGQDGGMLAYYLLYNNTVGDTNLYAFPEGFSMIAGNTNTRNFSNYPVPDIQKSDWTGVYTTQAFLEQAAVGFNCLNYALPAEGSLYRHFLPDKAYLDANCKDGVRFELMFPSCWNGVTNVTDQKSHVAYPSQVMTGDCPSTHPKRLVSLFYEIIWRTEDYIGKNGQFVIANGDPTGYGFHGDFIMGWDGNFLQKAVDTCTNPSGKIQDCPLFTIQDPSVYGSCNLTKPAALVGENVVSPSTLPGNPVIASGPGPADGATAGGSATGASATGAIVPTLSHSDGITVASSATYVPGAVFAAVTSGASPIVDVNNEAVVATSSTISSPVIETPAPTPGPVDAQSYFSTDYSTSGFTVQEVLWVEELQTVTVPVTTTAYHKRHVHKHKRRSS